MSTGNIYKVTSGCAVSLLATPGQHFEGMDIASTNYGQHATKLLVTSEGSALVRAIKPYGTVTVLNLVTPGGNPTAIPAAETMSTVPLDLAISGNPIE